MGRNLFRNRIVDEWNTLSWQAVRMTTRESFQRFDGFVTSTVQFTKIWNLRKLTSYMKRLTLDTHILSLSFRSEI